MCAGSTPVASLPRSHAPRRIDHRGDASRKESGGRRVVRSELPRKLWSVSGGRERAQSILSRIVEHVGLLGNEEDLQNGLGIAGPDGGSISACDPSVFVDMIGQVVAVPAADSRRRDHVARGLLDQSTSVERGGVDRWRRLHSADV